MPDFSAGPFTAAAPGSDKFKNLKGPVGPACAARGRVNLICAYTHAQAGRASST